MYSEDERLNKDKWNRIYKKRYKTEIDESMPKVKELLKSHGVTTVLDLGCGSGRHTVYLAEHGFSVYGIDISDEGIKKADQKVRNSGFHAVLTTGSIYHKLPYQTNFFDSIISTKVLHNGRIKNIRNAIKELERVLKPEGVIFVSVRKVPSKSQKKWEEVAPQTYIRTTGIPYYMFNEELLRKEFTNFTILNFWMEKGGYYCLFGKLK
ncbi:MAG: class I SAM-dependent methyltransferase [Candidatus Methanofastidiosia archaeon]|jgi:ubiquinone/menaquinone biosynthesis C-methylase UbiE